jgi:hypothetical protein
VEDVQQALPASVTEADKKQPVDHGEASWGCEARAGAVHLYSSGSLNTDEDITVQMLDGILSGETRDVIMQESIIGIAKTMTAQPSRDDHGGSR